MRPSIQLLLNMPESTHSKGRLEQLLQWAIELELSTIPPYLCALWSIKADDQGQPAPNDFPAYSRIRRILRQEMGHFGLACNLLNTLDGPVPRIADAATVPSYPGPLPGGVRPKVRLRLQGLTMAGVLNSFMEVEYPESGPIEIHRGRPFHTIGAFYEEILRQMELHPDWIKGSRQIRFGPQSGIELFEIDSIDAARRAIGLIKSQGEGADQSPFGQDDEVAHYYGFGEIYHQGEIEEADLGWDYNGSPVPFPSVYSVPPVPRCGYQTEKSREFDNAYTSILTVLQQAFTSGGDVGSALLDDRFVRQMTHLSVIARGLISTPRAEGGGNYCPSFRFLALR
jgi:hypothetical protein